MADPLLALVEEMPVLPGVEPTAMSACVSSPVTWGAVEFGSATYGSRGQPPFANEFVLGFDSAAAAHRAVTDAYRQFRRCPTPPDVDTDAWVAPRSSPTRGLNEWFANQRARMARRQGVDTVIDMYSLRVARRQNVVVVVETTSSDDNPESVLDQAMFGATGLCPWGRLTAVSR